MYYRLTNVFSKVAVALLMLSFIPTLHAGESNNLRAGAAKIEITPNDLSGSNVWSVWSKPFEGVHDPIFARAIVLDNGSTLVAIVATDLVEFGDTSKLRQRIAKELSIPADHIMIVASHDHNAPRGGPIQVGTSSQQGRPWSSPAYTQFIDDQVVAVVRQAKNSLQPARIGVGTGRVDVNTNRNGFSKKGGFVPDPEGVSDKTVWVIKIEDQSAKPIALLMNYAVHSAVAGPSTPELTGDLAGAAERFVEQHYGDKVIALWTMGAAGDQDAKYAMKGGVTAFDNINASGLLIATEVVDTADHIAKMSSTAQISAAERVISCAALQQAPDKQPAAASKPGPPPFPQNPYYKDASNDYPSSFEIRLGLIRVNQIAMTGVSGEVFTNIYLHLKKDSPLVNTMMLTMANGRIGYIAEDAAYGRPLHGVNLASGCAEDGIVNGLVEMIGEN